jgi:hypothetical protein
VGHVYMRSAGPPTAREASERPYNGSARSATTRRDTTPLAMTVI